MKKDTLVQFVCFETSLELDVFAPQWEDLVKNAGTKGPKAIILQEAISKTRYKYVSEHIWPQDDFQFVFMKAGRHSEHFPETGVKVIQAGGYIPLVVGNKKSNSNEGAIKILVFTTNAKTDISLLSDLPCNNLNIYEPYYESSMYAYILEYFVSESDAADLLQQLKANVTAPEIAIYRECLVPAL